MAGAGVNRKNPFAAPAADGGDESGTQAPSPSSNTTASTSKRSLNPFAGVNSNSNSSNAAAAAAASGSKNPFAIPAALGKALVKGVEDLGGAAAGATGYVIQSSQQATQQAIETSSDLLKSTASHLSLPIGGAEEAAAAIAEAERLRGLVEGCISVYPSPPCFSVLGVGRDLHTMAYDATNRLLAISAGSGSVTILGDGGMEAVLAREREGASPYVFLNFTFWKSRLHIVGVSSEGGVSTWDVAEQRRVGHITENCWPRGTNVSVACIPKHSHHNHLFLGTTEGKVHVCAVGALAPSVYALEPAEIFAKLDGPLARPDFCGPLAAIEASPMNDDLALFAFGPSGAVVLWNWAKRERLKIWEGGRRSISCLSWRPSGEGFVVGFSGGDYAIGQVKGGANTSSTRHELESLWLNDQARGSDSCSPIVFLDWVETRNGECALIVAGGQESLHGEEQDSGVTVVLDFANPSSSSTQSHFVPMWQPHETPLWFKAIQSPESLHRVDDDDSYLRFSILALLMFSSERSRPGLDQPLVYGHDARLAAFRVEIESERDEEMASTSSVTASHLVNHAEVTAAAISCPLSAMVVLNIASLSLQSGGQGEQLLVGGGLSWDPSTPRELRCEATALSEILILGHSDGSLTFWEVYAPPADEKEPRSGGAHFLGTLPLLQHIMSSGEEGTSAVTSLAVLSEGSSSSEIYVGVGFRNGFVSVLALGKDCDTSSPIHVSQIHIIGEDREEQQQQQPAVNSISNRKSASVSRSSRRLSRDDLAEAIMNAQAEAASIAAGGGDDQSLPGSSSVHNVADSLPSCIRFIMKLHSDSISSLVISWDPTVDSLCCAAIDSGGVASLSHVRTREVYVLQMSALSTVSCLPGLAVGPCPSELAASGSSHHSCLYVLLENQISLYSTCSGSLLASVGLGGAGGGGHRKHTSSAEAPPFVACTDEHGFVVRNGPSEPSWQTQRSDGTPPEPHLLIVAMGRLAFISCGKLTAASKKRSSFVVKSAGITVKGRQHAGGGVFSVTTEDGITRSLICVIDFEDGVSVWLLPELIPISTGMLSEEATHLLDSRIFSKNATDLGNLTPPPCFCVTSFGEAVTQTGPNRMERCKLTSESCTEVSGVLRMSKFADLSNVVVAGDNPPSEGANRAPPEKRGGLRVLKSLKSTLAPKGKGGKALDSFARAPSPTWQETAKSELFEGFSCSDSGKEQQRGGVSRVHAEMAEVNRQAQERGEKLSKLEERTRRLENDAEDFASMARQLNRDLDKQLDTCTLS